MSHSIFDQRLMYRDSDIEYKGFDLTNYESDVPACCGPADGAGRVDDNDEKKNQERKTPFHKTNKDPFYKQYGDEMIEAYKNGSGIGAISKLYGKSIPAVRSYIFSHTDFRRRDTELQSAM